MAPPKSAPQSDALEAPVLDPVTFELVDAEMAIRHCVGGVEIAIDEGGRYQTAEPAEIAALDAHPCCKRVEAS